MATKMTNVFCVGWMFLLAGGFSCVWAGETTNDGVYRVDGKPFIRRSGFGGATTFRDGLFMQLGKDELGGERDLYTRCGLNTIFYDIPGGFKESGVDFKVLDDFLERAKKAGQKVVFHLPQSIPKWLAAKRDWHWIGPNGERIANERGLPHHNPDEYATAMRELLTPLIKHIQDNKEVIGYQISGEHHPYDGLGANTQISYDAWTLGRWRQHLTKRFNLRELSQRYGKRPDFYASLEDVYPPALNGKDFKGRALPGYDVASWDWYRFKKLASVECWVALVKALQQLDGHGRSVHYEFNHGPYSDVRLFPLYAAAAGAPGFGLGNGDFEDLPEQVFLYSGFVKAASGNVPWINNELEAGWSGSFRNDPTGIDAAYMRQHIWVNLALGSQGYSLWTFPNLVGYTPDNAKNLAKQLASPDFAARVQPKWCEVRHANAMIDALGDVLAGTVSPAADIGIFMLDDASFNWRYVESYNRDVLGMVHTLKAQGYIDRTGIYTEYHLDEPSFDLNQLKVIFLPRSPRLLEAHVSRLAQWVKDGGKLFLFGEIGRIGESFDERPEFPRAELAEAAGVKAKLLSSKELQGHGLDATLLDGTPLFLNSRTAIIEPLDAKVKVLARQNGAIAVTMNSYGRGQCFYFTGEPVMVDDGDSTGRAMAGLLKASGILPAASLTEGANPADGVFIARRSSSRGTLFTLVETANRRHVLKASFCPELLGLKRNRNYHVFECFAGLGPAMELSSAGGWSVPLRLEPFGVRCLWVTKEEKAPCSFSVPEKAGSVLSAKGPWDEKSKAQRPYLSDEPSKERLARLDAEKIKADSTKVRLKPLGNDYFGIDFQSVTNADLSTMVADVDLAPQIFGVKPDLEKSADVNLLQVMETGKLGKVPVAVGAGYLKVLRSVNGLTVGCRAKTVHFFHGGHYGEHESLLGSYRVKYADGSFAVVPVVVQSTLSDFTRPAWRTERCVRIYDGQGAKGQRFHLDRYDWTNPFPEKKIIAIDAVNAEQCQQTSWALWGITVKGLGDNSK
ncbi:MAG: beta-galactosidase [bacterium]